MKGITHYIVFSAHSVCSDSESSHPKMGSHPVNTPITSTRPEMEIRVTSLVID